MRIPFTTIDWWDLKRRLLKRCRAWTRRYEAWHDRRRRLYERLTSAIERIEKMAASYEDQTFHQAVTAAVARAVLSELGKDEGVHQQLLDEVRRELLASCRGEALELARAELTIEMERYRERLDDRLAKDRLLVQQEADASIEAGLDKALRGQQEDWTLEIQRARRQRSEARQERDQAVALLLDLVKQIFGPKGRVYALSRGIESIDLFHLNAVVGKKGLRVRSQLTESTRLVRVKLDGSGREEARSVFWLEPVIDPPTDEPDDDTMPAPLVSDTEVSRAGT